MKRNLIFAAFLALCGTFALTSCSDDDDNNIGGGSNSGGESSEFCYILNQGNWGGNDASLQMYDMTTGSVSMPDYSNDIFTIANREPLGDTAQDLLWVGDRLFITVSGSQKLEVLDESGKRIHKHIYAAEGAAPRYMATDGENVYVTNHDGHVYVYDAASGDSITRIYSGSYPEGISYVDGSLVVNNSNYGGYGGGEASITIIDTKTRKIIKTITENVCNPYSESVVCNGDVYIIDSGNYNDIPSRILRVNIEEGTTAIISGATMLSAHDESIYFINASFSYETNVYIYSALYKMDVTSGETTAVVPAAQMKDVYSLDINPETGDIYVGFAQYGVLGTMRVYDGGGTQRALFDIGYYTSGARFRN